ncbi:MAG: phage portal protein, partial [Armatimonadetes bacterium]|nr:phage portal protein [Armatimonadota bacterium]
GRNLVEGYIYEANGKQVAFGSDEVLHFRYYSPCDDFYGLSPLAAAVDSVTTDLFAIAYNQGFFRRGARPEGVITSQVELSEEELKRLRAQFEEIYAGAENAHRVLILGSDLQWQSLGVSPKEADFLQQRRLSREEICAVFGVPPAVVGIYQYANYANAQLQRRLFWCDTILPKLARIEGVINEHLTPRFGRDLVVEFDTSRVPALQAEAREQAEVAAILVKSGILSIQEARSIFYGLG